MIRWNCYTIFARVFRQNMKARLQSTTCVLYTLRTHVHIVHTVFFKNCTPLGSLNFKSRHPKESSKFFLIFSIFQFSSSWIWLKNKFLGWLLVMSTRLLWGRKSLISSQNLQVQLFSIFLALRLSNAISNAIVLLKTLAISGSQWVTMEERTETVPLMLNLMRMSRETICGNKLLVHKLSNTIPTGVIEIRASTIRWILNVRLRITATIRIFSQLENLWISSPRLNISFTGHGFIKLICRN